MSPLRIDDAYTMWVLSDGHARTREEIHDAVREMGDDQRVEAIQNWLPVFSAWQPYREDDE